MFNSKRLITVGKRIALLCASLLLLVISVSNGHSSGVGNRLRAHVLRQAVVLRTQYLQRPANVPTRVAKLERSKAKSERSSAASSATTDFASLQAWQPSIFPRYRVLPPHTFRAVVLPRQQIGHHVERARAPPATIALVA
jgi:hypothetical protein